MRYAVEYRLKSGVIGLTLFTAKDDQAAREYVEAMEDEHGHADTFNLKPLPVCSVAYLHRLYPGTSDITMKGHGNKEGD